MLKIVEYPHKMLRKRCQKLKVKDIQDPQIQELFSEMKETMVKKDGIGLAAPQVDKNLRLLVVNLKDGPSVFINPRIYWKSFFKRNIVEEGCLSFPEIFGLVKRLAWIYVSYFDQQGKFQLLKAEGLLARVLLHEIDHLNGVLFIDKIIKYTKGEDKIKKLKEQAKSNER
ncbi:peptide deformylase [Patescibacteria group bacterium]|nr:peptide deformylase [Patescibacteria group bacterium]